MRIGSRWRRARGGSSSALLQRLASASPEAVHIDRPTFVSMMLDKAVQDFAAGESALLPVFESLDTDADGKITQAELLTTIDHFCNELPDSDGCDTDHRPLRLALAFNAFANDEKLLDYERFVEMVSGRSTATAD